MKELKKQILESILSSDDDLDNRKVVELHLDKISGFNADKLREIGITYEDWENFMDVLTAANVKYNMSKLKPLYFELYPYWTEDHKWQISIFANKTYWHNDDSFANIYYNGKEFMCDEDQADTEHENLYDIFYKMVDEINYNEDYIDNEAVKKFRV